MHKENMKEIESLVKKLQDSKKCTFANIADIINNCMSNKSKDVNMIEHYLDYLFDCIYDDNSLRYAYKVCDYLEKLDENSGNFYRNTLNEYYPEYKKK
ncbi:MAG: hypothetical protein U0N10_03665 [Bacilli bacterium]